MFTNTLYLLNKNAQLSYVYKTKQKFTYKLYLQSKIQNRKFTKQKTKVYIQVMFTKQNTKQKVYKSCVYKTSYVYKTKYKTAHSI